jgi:hypothetical protein
MAKIESEAMQCTSGMSKSLLLVTALNECAAATRPKPAVRLAVTERRSDHAPSQGRAHPQQHTWEGFIPRRTL